jgi:phenylacetate-CoA ligase
MPLIRYRMDDVLVPVVESSNPLPFTQVKALVGRQENALTFINEHGLSDFIHPIVIVELMIPGLNSWQIVLTGPSSFVVRAVLAGALTSAERQATFERTREKFRAMLDEKEMSNVTFEIQERQTLEKDPRSGKFMLVLNEPEPTSELLSASIAHASA